MNLRRITSRTAAVGATTALAAGALVGFTAPAATAAEASNVYSCTQSMFNITFDTNVTASGALPAPQYWAGAPIPEGLLGKVTATASIDAETAATLGSFGVTEARADDFSFDLGGASVPVPLTGQIEAGDDGAAWVAEGTNDAFTTGDPGTVDVLMPQGFTFTAVVSGQDVALSCVLAEGETAQAIATDFLLMQQSSSTEAKNLKVKKGKKAVLKATVTSTSMGGPVAPGGEVVAKKGKKTLATGKVNKKGIAKLNLGKKLKVGKHKLTVTYLGVPSFSESSAKATVTVKKAKKGKK